MKYRVTKPFNTRQRRLAAGAEITENEDLTPHTVTSALAAKLIEEVKAAPAPAPAAPEAPAPAARTTPKSGD